MSQSFVVVGAGPAGLTAANTALGLGVRPLVLEKSRCVGGLARTELYRGFRFDVGGHRFYTRLPEIEALWRDVLGDAFLKRPRLSRIYYRQRYIPYPLRIGPTLGGLGPLESARILGSWAAAQLRPRVEERTLEDWVGNRFGRRLYEIFFKSYSEKVWGRPSSEIRADWAAQRLKDLSMRALLQHALKRPGAGVRSLIEEFHYPRLGPGMMWGKLSERLVAGGARVLLETELVRIERDGWRARALTMKRGGGLETIPVSHVISSVPVAELLASLDPPPPQPVLDAVGSFGHRDFLSVCLLLRRANLFPDNWIYVHDPGVRVARIQNFRNWSPEMAPDPAITSLGLEYFCQENDALWAQSDADLVALAKRELEAVGLARAADVFDGCVLRAANAYPVYDEGWARNLPLVRAFLGRFENVQTVGRNGLHRYNNQDHSMLTGMLAVRRALLGEPHDLWAVNSDGSYLESSADASACRRPAEPAAGLTPDPAAELTL